MVLFEKSAEMKKVQYSRSIRFFFKIDPVIIVKKEEIKITHECNKEKGDLNIIPVYDICNVLQKLDFQFKPSKEFKSKILFFKVNIINKNDKEYNDNVYIKLENPFTYLNKWCEFAEIGSNKKLVNPIPFPKISENNDISYNEYRAIIPPKLEKWYNNLIEDSEKFIYIFGPKGNGKTSTLLALRKKLLYSHTKPPLIIHPFKDKNPFVNMIRSDDKEWEIAWKIDQCILSDLKENGGFRHLLNNSNCPLALPEFDKLVNEIPLSSDDYLRDYFSKSIRFIRSLCQVINVLSDAFQKKMVIIIDNAEISRELIVYIMKYLKYQSEFYCDGGIEIKIILIGYYPLEYFLFDTEGNPFISGIKQIKFNADRILGTIIKNSMNKGIYDDNVAFFKYLMLLSGYNTKIGMNFFYDWWDIYFSSKIHDFENLQDQIEALLNKDTFGHQYCKKYWDNYLLDLLEYLYPNEFKKSEKDVTSDKKYIEIKKFLSFLPEKPNEGLQETDWIINCKKARLSNEFIAQIKGNDGIISKLERFGIIKEDIGRFHLSIPVFNIFLR